jgi:hypothetical protein
MIFRVLSKCGRRPAALPITGACRHDSASCRVAHVQERSATIWLPPNRKQQRSMSSSMYGRFSASSSNSAFNKPAGFCPASDENESSTEFQNGGRNQFPNATKNLMENKAVSLNNTAL